MPNNNPKGKVDFAELMKSNTRLTGLKVNVNPKIRYCDEKDKDGNYIYPRYEFDLELDFSNTTFSRLVYGAARSFVIAYATRNRKREGGKWIEREHKKKHYIDIENYFKEKSPGKSIVDKVADRIETRKATPEDIARLQKVIEQYRKENK